MHRTDILRIPQTGRARLNGLERQALKNLAKREGLNESELIRQLIRFEAKRQGVWPTLEEPSRERQAA